MRRMAMAAGKATRLVDDFEEQKIVGSIRELRA
jgi:hypothetical protein